jgi:hypothetical protein
MESKVLGLTCTHSVKAIRNFIKSFPVSDTLELEIECGEEGLSDKYFQIYMRTILGLPNPPENQVRHFRLICKGQNGKPLTDDCLFKKLDIATRIARELVHLDYKSIVTVS